MSEELKTFSKSDRRKRLLWVLKTCKAYMQKAAQDFLELSENHINHRADMLIASTRQLDKWIAEEEYKAQFLENENE